MANPQAQVFQQEKEQEIDIFGFDENVGDFTEQPWLLMKINLAECENGIVDFKEQLKKRGVNPNEVQTLNPPQTSKQRGLSVIQRTLQRLENQNMEVSDEELYMEDSEVVVGSDDDGEEGGGDGEQEVQARPKRRNQDEYHYGDGFLDDSMLVKRINRERLKTKYEGFFVNRGPIEVVPDQPAQSTQEQKKQKRGGSRGAKRKAADDEEAQQSEQQTTQAPQLQQQQQQCQSRQAQQQTGQEQQPQVQQQQQQLQQEAGSKECGQKEQGGEKEKEKPRDKGTSNKVVNQKRSNVKKGGGVSGASQKPQKSDTSEEEAVMRPASAESNQVTNEENQEQTSSKGEVGGPSKDSRSSKKATKEFEIPEELFSYIKDIEKVASGLAPPDPNKKNTRCPDLLVKELANLVPVYYSSCGNSIKAKDKVVSELMKHLEPWFKDKTKLKCKLSELQRKDGKEDSQLESLKSELQSVIRSKAAQLAKLAEPWDEQILEKVNRYIEGLSKAGKGVDWNALTGLWSLENLTMGVAALQEVVQFSQQGQVSQNENQ
eukprot:TRINITY_DN8586_c1_g2_i1.p1 TRINITY_DN8586_c1_g2~~TRINITY_DN8586_c1_g2_i1.p1  ORF type:complete len:613 (-),score=134.45 TRINITY_DN8586_c1_g2_i1:296-1927(-)